MFRYTSLPTRRARFRPTAPPNFLTGDITMRLKESPFSTKNSLAPGQSAFFRDPKTRFRAACPLSLSRLVRLFLIGGAELYPALPPSAHQNEATAFGLHPGSKTEPSGSFSFARLVGSFHMNIS